jgi:type I restriction enzyme M protein
VFYGAGVPACLVILRKNRAADRRSKLLLVYAARHYRDLSAQNELRPQDVMRILVHYHAYGAADRVSELVSEHRARIQTQIDRREADEVALVVAEYEAHAGVLEQSYDVLAGIDGAVTSSSSDGGGTARKTAKHRANAAVKIAERDLRIAEMRRRADEDRQDVDAVGAELVALYAQPDELIKHARVVDPAEVEENDFNLNVPRYVDTFEPEPHIDVTDALQGLARASQQAEQAKQDLLALLSQAGYETD